MAKNNLFGQKFLRQAKQNNFELKMLKLLENHVETQLREWFFKFFNWAIFLKILTKSQKMWFFCQKINFLALFGQNFQKYCLFKNLEKKKFLENCLNMIFKNISIF